VTYKYDGDGNRILKSSGKAYWYGAGTEILDESDLSGNITNEYVFFGGKRIAMRTISTGTIDYYEEDMLGSSRTIVQAGQTSPCFDADFLPFGKEVDVTNTCTQNYKFEGKERDTESGNDDFGARYYSSRLGRWLSADWSATPEPVPYANLSNPQTLNLYAMVRDNPETFADLDGHDCCDIWDAVNFVLGALNAYGSDNLAGAGRQSQGTTAGNLGQAVGDTVATIEGVEKMGAGGTMVAASIPEDATGVGVAIGVPQAAAGSALATQGAVEGSQGLGNLIKDVTSPLESRSSGPKAADAAGVSAGGQATNEHGQKLGPSKKPQVNNVSKNTREGANNAANKGSGTVEHRNPSGDKPHFHTKRSDGTKKQDSTHYNYPG
jgi:RHS repeat-associated protein